MTGTEDLAYDGCYARGVPHPHGWVWRTTTEHGEIRDRIVGTAGLAPVTLQPDREAADAGEPVSAAEAADAWRHADGFIAVLNLMEGCPSCQSDLEPEASSYDDEDWTDRLDWGDADLRAEAEQVARSRGYWQNADRQWHQPWSDEGCERCGGWHEDSDAIRGPLVPALPMDVQPAAWLRELVRELGLRMSNSPPLPDVARVRWEVTLSIVDGLLNGLPDIPPESWWPEATLRSEADTITRVREALGQRTGEHRGLAPPPPVDDDDVPF